MTKTISVRLEEVHLRALDSLAHEEGVDRSGAIRLALDEALVTRRRARLRQESLAVATDAEDLQEMRNIARDMDPLRTW